MSFSPVETLEETATERRGATVLLETISSVGCEYVFGNPGTTELPLIDALLDAPHMKYVWGLQEASVVAMADGYAQAARKPGFINLHTAGGLGHGMGNLLNAAVSCTPLVVTAGQQDTRHAITDPLLMGDLVSIARPAVKWAQEVTSANQLPVLLRRAFQDANAAPSGPVFLSLPMDVMEEMSSVPIDSPSVVDRRSVAGSLDLLADYLVSVKPKRLAIIAGDEIHSSDAASEVLELAQTLAAPVFGSSWPARIPFPTSSPFWAGNLPTKATEIAKTLSEFDAIFALGGKSLITILYSHGSAVPKGCDVYQLSADVRDLGRTYVSRLSAVGDIKASLEVLLPLLKQRAAKHAEAYAAARKEASVAQTERRAKLNELAASQWDAPFVSPLVAAQQAMLAIGNSTPIVDEAIVTSHAIRSFLNSDSPRQYSFLRGGGLGWGMPAAVGCSLGLGREPVVCLVGDGAALYSPQAMWTAAYEKLPVTFVVMNNREYNVLKNFMRSQAHFSSAKSERFIAMDINDPPIDYLALATSMGVPARRVTKAGDIAPAIEAGIASGAVNLIEVVIGV
jgi:benzoylformate decarboxylase